MSTATRLRIRRWLIVLASAAGWLGWAVAAAADPSAPLRGDTPASKPDAAGPATPPKWANAAELLDASGQVNATLVEYESKRAIFPWDKADLVRRMLLANRDLLEQLHPNGQGNFQQALYLSSIAAGYPDDAMAAARATVKLAEQLKLPKMQMMSAWLTVSWAGMLQGDRAACLEVVDQMQKLAGTTEGFDAMKRELEPVGTTPICQLKLSDRTTINPGRCPGQVLMVDFWMFNNPATQDAAPLVRAARQMFAGYPDFRVIGVNMDSVDSQPAALRFAEGHGYDWPSFFEGQTDRAISNKIFMVHYLPTEIVIGPDGKVIFAGKPNNTTLVYAIRAGLVKANKGEIPKSQPDGVARPAAPFPADTGLPEKLPDTPVGKTTPTPPADNADQAEQEKAAAQQLRVALAFVAADATPQAIEKLKQIILKWPNTKAGFEAKAKLVQLEY